MTKQAITELILYAAACPLSLFFMLYSIRTYYRGSITLKSGRILDKREAPVRFWMEVVGGGVIAAVLAFTGTVHLIEIFSRY